MSENNLTPEESFSIIDKAIANFKMNYKDSSSIFLLFGWIFTVASISNYFILKILHAQEAYNLMGPLSLGNWFVLSLIGFTILFIMKRKATNKKKVYSYLESYIQNLWWVTAAAFIIAIVLSMQLGIDPPPLMLLVAGIATTTTGLLIKFRPLTIGGMTFFIFSIATTFVSNENISLIVGAAIVCGYLIPGYFLKSAKE